MAKDDDKGAPEEQAERLELVHPVYLDTPMMVSFVAALEGGVSYGAESTQMQAQTAGREREGGARFGVPILSSLLSLDMSGRMSSNVGTQNTEEVKVVRRHTEASLFNLLRHRLVSDGEVTPVKTREQLSELRPGQLIEISGEVTGNPLQQLFALLTKMLPYMGLDEEAVRGPAKDKQPPGNPKSGNPAKRAAAKQELTKDEEETLDGIRMLFIMKDDLEIASVRDVVLAGDDSITTVLTLSTEFFSDQTTDYVLGGRFTALGKVTRILAGEDTVNLTRRTALGVAGPDMARDIVQSFTQDDEFFIEATDPIVGAPAIQVLPLALFV
jgi:hypothetical protein